MCCGWVPTLSLLLLSLTPFLHSKNGVNNSTYLIVLRYEFNEVIMLLAQRQIHSNCLKILLINLVLGLVLGKNKTQHTETSIWRCGWKCLMRSEAPTSSKLQFMLSWHCNRIIFDEFYFFLKLVILIFCTSFYKPLMSILLEYFYLLWSLYSSKEQIFHCMSLHNRQ